MFNVPALKVAAPLLPVVVKVNGTVHVPSPLQNVVEDADVPLFKFVTGKFPETSAVNETAPKVGAPAALPCNTVVVVPNDPKTVGAAPAPPPKTIALAVNAALLAHVEDDEKYGIPPLVPATVKASVPVDVIGEPETDINPPVNVWATLVTVPVVVLKVPDVGKVTDVFPVKVKVLVKAPESVWLPPIVNVAVPLLTPVPPFAEGTIEKLVVGALPAPPPNTNCPEVNAAEDAHAEEDEK